TSFLCHETETVANFLFPPQIAGISGNADGIDGCMAVFSSPKDSLDRQSVRGPGRCPSASEEREPGARRGGSRRRPARDHRRYAGGGHFFGQELGTASAGDERCDAG